MLASQAVRHANVPYYRSVMLPTALLGCLLIITLSMQVILSMHALNRLAPVNGHISQLVSLQGTNLKLQRELVDSLSDESAFTGAERQQIQEELQAILNINTNLSNDTHQALTRAHDVLADAKYHPKEALIFALSYTRKAIELEARAQQKLIATVNRATALEFQIALITLVVFPAGAALLLFLMRRRILAPLNHLSYLMTLLQTRDYAHAPAATIDPLLRPLLENYNAMVLRLTQLEKEQALREQRLESQIQDAARTLLAQQRSLANTERLAAVGEMTARVAHDLRNPLAGVKMACKNIQRELSHVFETREQAQRMQAVAEEIERMITVLNSLLDQSCHRPEPLRDIVVAKVVAELLMLARYQIPERIRLEQQIPENIVCYLPDAALRQALLNLILNAQHAIGEHAGKIVVNAICNEGRLEMTICDDGPGFPKDMLQTGIHAFVTHRPEGTGLGLSMVQRFARDLGGSVSLSNVEPHGARVTLELPCGRSDV